MNLSAILTSPTKWLQRVAPKGGLLRNAFALGGVTLTAQAVSVLLAPVYSRLYSPADYGVFSIFSSIVATALTVGSLSYEKGIPVGTDDGEAVGLTGLAILIVVVIGLGVAAWLGLQALGGFGGNGLQLGRYLWLVPAAIIAAGVFHAISFWALRRKAIGAIARTSVLQVISSNTMTLGFGILSPSPLGFMLAGIVGSSAGMWGLARRTELVQRMRAERGVGLTLGQLWLLAKKYRRFALISTPSTLFNSLGLYLPGILLAPYFGAEFAGQFFMAMKVIGIPLTLIGGAIYQVFFSGAAAVARERPQDLAPLFHRVVVRGTACSLLILLIGLVAPWAVPVALGEKWRQAGEITFWLSLYSVVGLTASPLSCIPSIVGRLRGQFVIDVVRACAVFLLFYLCHRFGLAAMAVVKGYTVVMLGNYVACYCLYHHQVQEVSRTGRTSWRESPTIS